MAHDHIRDNEDWDSYVTRCPNKTVTLRMLGASYNALLQTMAVLVKRIAELEQQLADRQFKGVFEAGVAYRTGNMVTFQGSTWHCNNPTMRRPGEPGDGASDWTLMTKRGRDGRDVR